MKNKLVQGLAALFLVAVLVLAIVFNRGQVLKFETIDQGEFLDSYIGSIQPNMLIISQKGNIANPGKGVQFPFELVEKLRYIDYEEFLVIILFRGLTGSFSEKFTIDPSMVLRSSNRVIIKTTLGEPPKESGVGFLQSYPYRIIKISKSGHWNREITFILDIGGKAVDKQKHFVP